MYLIARIVSNFFELLTLLILVRIVISWFPNVDINSKPVKFIYSVTDPIMEPVREFTLKYINLGPIDISPIIVILLLNIARSIIMRILYF